MNFFIQIFLVVFSIVDSNETTDMVPGKAQAPLQGAPRVAVAVKKVPIGLLRQTSGPVHWALIFSDLAHAALGEQCSVREAGCDPEKPPIIRWSGAQVVCATCTCV